jgi:hypothetical protein
VRFEDLAKGSYAGGRESDPDTWQVLIGQLTMRNTDSADSREKLGADVSLAAIEKR